MERNLGSRIISNLTLRGSRSEANLAELARFGGMRVYVLSERILIDSNLLIEGVASFGAEMAAINVNVLACLKAVRKC